ncbi:MFS transporter [Mumia sp. DW29H23]|uniref:MFS transporter n=1 Tax=Mumia sp. DW29H23 TaxID=3421241 RepID=UPI003D697A63
MRTPKAVGGIVGALFFVELVSGMLQGYYTPLMTDIARNLGIHDADVNWFEAAQLLVSAMLVPVLSKLGDLYGHRRLLLIAAVVTAVSTWGIAFAPGFGSYLVFWAAQGIFTVWLPLEVALIHIRSAREADPAATTRRATGIIVAALQAGAIFGALSAGLFDSVFDGDLVLVLSVPAVATTLVVLVVVRWVPDVHHRSAGRVDLVGAGLLSTSLLLVVGGLMLVRVDGLASPWPWLTFALGLVLLVPFVRQEKRHPDPLIDLAVMRRSSMWPVQLTALLFGVSILGAQIPLSTFARTDPDEYGYGLGLSASGVAPVIGLYVLSLLVGAALFARVSAALTPRRTLIGAATLVGIGYLGLLLLHDSLPEVVLCMATAGLGSGALVAALPAAAASAAPPGGTAVATGLTNTTKTLGGAFASSVFALALASGGTVDPDVTAAPLHGYVTVWAICGVTALIAAACLVVVPRGAFSHQPVSTPTTPQEQP